MEIGFRFFFYSMLFYTFPLCYLPLQVDVSGAYESLPHTKLVEVISQVLSPVQDQIFTVRRYAKIWADAHEGLKKSFIRQVHTHILLFVFLYLQTQTFTYKLVFHMFLWCSQVSWLTIWDSPTWRGLWCHYKKQEKFIMLYWWSRWENVPQCSDIPFRSGCPVHTSVTLLLFLPAFLCWSSCQGGPRVFHPNAHCRCCSIWEEVRFAPGLSCHYETDVWGAVCIW